jgi:stage III sporulation protein AE
MPEETTNFGAGMLEILGSALRQLRPELAQGAGVCLAVTAVVLLASLVGGLPGKSDTIIRLVCTLALGTVLLKQTGSMIRLGTETVQELSEYGKLLIPVMTAALASQGGITASAALYAGTAAFDAVLSSLVGKLLVPLVYLFLVISLANGATGRALLKKLRDLIKWLCTWGLKTVLYIFTGYMSITGVISGTADASAIKAAKIAISGFVPVVGGIISDASETILVGAGIMKNTVGIYGLFVMISLFIGPFLKIGVQYLLMKLTGAISGIFASKQTVELLNDFTGAMGMLLSMIGVQTLLMIVSTVCFMRGVT